MWDNWIGRRIRGGGRVLLLAGLFLCACAGVVGWLTRYALADGLVGPVPLDAGQLLGLGPGGRSVTFDAPGAVDTGATAGHDRRPGVVAARYFAAPVEGRWVLVKTPAGHQGSSFTGTPDSIGRDERERVTQPFARDNDFDEGLFLPVRVDGTRDIGRDAGAALFFVVAFLGSGLVLVGLGLRRILRPQTHPLAKALARFGPPAEVAAEVDAGPRPLRLGPVEIAGDWLVCHSRQSGCVVFRTDELVWVHKLVVTINGKDSPRLKLYDRRGVRFEGGGKADAVDAAIAAVTNRVPWVVVGWDERVERQWADDAASLVPRVEERRQELLERAARRTEP